MIDDIAVPEAGKTADGQARICRPQPQDRLFHMPFFFPVPAGDLCIGLYQKVRSVKIKPCRPSGSDGFQTDMIRDTAEHSLHSLLGLPHKAQRPCRYTLFECRSILFLRHDHQKQSIQHAEIQILRSAEDHPTNLNIWGFLQKNSRSTAQRLCIKQIQPSVQFFFDISRQLVRLIPGSRVGRFACSVKAVEADGMCQLLKGWRKECEWDRAQTANEIVDEDDYLFRQPNGKPMNPCTFTYRFKLIVKANNLPLDLNVHSLRHTNASLLIAQGVDVRTVASLLGHAQASTTLDIYAHAFDKNKRKAQEKLGKAIEL